MSPDPYVDSAGPESPSSWNRYVYVEGDPINLIDPRGLDYETPDYDPKNPGNVAPGGTSITIFDTFPFIDTNSADYQQNLDAFRYYYSGAYYAGSPCRPESLPQKPCDDYYRDMEGTVEGKGMPGGKSLYARVVENLYGDPSKWPGHMEQIENYRGKLRDILQKLRKDNCPDPPSGVMQWYEQTSEKNLLKVRDQIDATRRVIEIGMAAYFIYRGVRLIPSLFPPLWPTLPANLAIP